MGELIFPDPTSADEDGIVGFGGELTVPNILNAYSKGIFPWPISDEYPLAWFSPPRRGVLNFKDLHISRSLKKTQKKKNYTICMNKNFPEVISQCAKTPRNGQSDTWITPEIINSYLDLFRLGFAYSIEAYQNNKLVGGLYGVHIGSFVSGESMFFVEDNTSKIVLWSLMEYLNSKTISIIDIQMVTPVLKTLGGVEISRDLFLKNLPKLINDKKNQDIFKNFKSLI